jgi:hypothetical protein
MRKSIVYLVDRAVSPSRLNAILLLCVEKFHEKQVSLSGTSCGLKVEK